MQNTDPPTPNALDKLTSFLPLLWFSLAFMLGILASSWVRSTRSFWLDLAHKVLPPQLPLDRNLWLLLIGLVLVLTLFLVILIGIVSIWRSRPFRIPTPALLLVSFLVVLFFAGAARYHFTIPFVDAHYISWYNDREYELLVTGTVVSPPDERDTYTNLRLEVSEINTGDNPLPVHGLMLARLDPGGDWHYGDVLRVRGHLKTPPSGEEFSYADYLARQGMRAYMPDAGATKLPFTGGKPLLRLVYAFKDQALARLYQIFPDPEAALLAGILLGDDNGLPADLQQAYRNTGTAHIIAISGFNITIIAGLFILLFSRLLGRRRGAILAVLGILLYTVLVGATASVVRAAIMGTLAIFARQLGRRQNGLNTLAFTAALMAMINPLVLWDVGFQLSFAATLGLILYAQPFEDWAERLVSRFVKPEKARKVASLVSATLLFTLAAQLTTLPIMAYHFGRISLVSLIANPFILPAQPAVMVLSGLALLLSFIYLPLGKVFGWIAWPFAAYTDRAVELFNRIPNGTIVLGEFSLLFVLLFYLVLFAWSFARPRLKGVLRTALAPAGIIAVLGVTAALVFSAVFAAPDGQLHLTFLDVGSADAILIQTPSGRTILVNGGESPSALASALGRRLSPFDRRIDWLVVASPQEEQMAALPSILERFPVGNVLWAGNLQASWSAQAVTSWLSEHSTPVTPAYAGAALDLGGGARLETLAVSPRGSVLLVEWQGFRALLPVGMNFDTLEQLQNDPKTGTVTLLLLADAGFAPLNPPEWIKALHPQLAVLSVAAGDPDGLPDPAVLDELEGLRLLRTDQNGWIKVSTDGSGMTVEVQRK
jgi:competence protein ComEC